MFAPDHHLLGGPDMRARTVVNITTRWLMLWRFNPLAIPADREQASKVRTAFNDIAKRMLEMGALQDWGIYADSSGGYALRDDRGDTEVDLSEALEATSRMMPFMTCDVRSVMDVDQARATIKQS